MASIIRDLQHTYLFMASGHALFSRHANEASPLRRMQAVLKDALAEHWLQFVNSWLRWQLLSHRRKGMRDVDGLTAGVAWV